MITWNIEKRRLRELTPLDNNPRTITERGFTMLKKDLLLGHFKPLVIDTNNIILAGNQRYRAMLQMYDQNYEVLCSVPSQELSEQDRKKIIIVDNRHRGKDDMDILANEFEDILKELDFDDTLPKFSEDDILEGETKCPRCNYQFKSND